MTALEKKIWHVFERPQTAALATISSNGAPWVRYVTVRAEPDLTLGFCTGLSTRKAREIAAEPSVHLTCGELRPPDLSVFLQVAGHAEIRSDRETKARCWRQEWSRYFQGPEDPEYIMVFVHPTRIEFNGPGSNEPEVWGE